MWHCRRPKLSALEYWQLEKRKFVGSPPEKELSRRIAFVVGRRKRCGTRDCSLAAQRGAHVVVADLDLDAARTTSVEAERSPKGICVGASIDIRDRESIRNACGRLSVPTAGSTSS